MSANGTPYDWTEEYVRTHRRECFSELQRINQRVLFDLLEGDSYDDVIVRIHALREGLLKLVISGVHDDVFITLLIQYLTAEGTLLVFGDPSKFREFDESARRRMALEQFTAAQEFGESHQDIRAVRVLIDAISPVISGLEAGIPLAQIGQDSGDILHGVTVTLHNGGELLARRAAAAAPDRTPEVGPRRQQYPPAASAPQVSRPQAVRPASKPARKKRGRALGWLLGTALLAAAAFAFLVRFPEPGTAERTPPDDEEQEEIAEHVEALQDTGVIFPGSSTELLDQREIEGLSDSDLTLAIDEIYARHGYIFKSQDLREYYQQFSWYTEEIPADEFSVECFGQVEQQNWDALVNERTRRGR